jgi:predicted enzyme related to lactoylglutathione lyase
MNNRVVHFEIPAENPRRLVNFYEQLFGWKIQEMEGANYWLAQTGEEGEPGIDGAIAGIDAEGPGPKRVPINYVSVPSVDEYVEKASKLGARVTVGKQAVPGMGWFAQMLDLEGNPLGIWQTDEGATL